MLVSQTTLKPSGMTENLKMPKRINENSYKIFVEKARALWGDTYDYPENQAYLGSKEKLKIICKVHGEFLKSPNQLLKVPKSGCKRCGIERRVDASRLDGNEELAKLQELFPTYADFAFEGGTYTKVTDKVSFFCPEHGKQSVRLSALKTGVGCGVCNTLKGLENRKLSLEEFLARAKAVHGDRYDYSKSVYKSTQTDIEIVCKEHGAFWQNTYHHMKGSGCPRCFFDSRSEVFLPFTTFLSRAVEVHGDRYTYSDTGYTGVNSEVEIRCKEHGVFLQRGSDHLAGCNCPICAGIGSEGQRQLTDFLRGLGVEVLENYRIGLGKHEVDCYIPEAKLAIEYDGLKWHSTLHRPKTHALNKRNALESSGVSLVRIFEDEWLLKQEVIKSLLSSRLGLSKSKAYARNTEVVEVSDVEARKFYGSHHIQGWRRNGKNFGLALEGKLVAVMTFTSSLSHRGVQAEGVQELARFATSTNVVGAASRLLKALVKVTNAKLVVSYSDNRLFSGKMYSALGFKEVHKTEPSYTYWDSKSSNLKGRQHKANFTREKLQTMLGERFDPKLTEKENCELAGFYQVFDCGLTKWELKM